MCMLRMLHDPPCKLSICRSCSPELSPAVKALRCTHSSAASARACGTPSRRACIDTRPCSAVHSVCCIVTSDVAAYRCLNALVSKVRSAVASRASTPANVGLSLASAAQQSHITACSPLPAAVTAGRCSRSTARMIAAGVLPSHGRPPCSSSHRMMANE